MDVEVFLKADRFNMVLVFHVVEQEFFLVMDSKAMAVYLEVFLFLFEIIVYCASNFLSGDKGY